MNDFLIIHYLPVYTFACGFFRQYFLNRNHFRRHFGGGNASLRAVWLQ